MCFFFFSCIFSFVGLRLSSLHFKGDFRRSPVDAEAAFPLLLPGSLGEVHQQPCQPRRPFLLLCLCRGGCVPTFAPASAAQPAWARHQQGSAPCSPRSCLISQPSPSGIRLTALPAASNSSFFPRSHQGSSTACHQRVRGASVPFEGLHVAVFHSNSLTPWGFCSPR